MQETAIRGSEASAPRRMVFGQNPDPDAFSEALRGAGAFLQAIAYAERAGIAAVWIDDPGGYFPSEKRPVRDVGDV